MLVAEGAVDIAAEPELELYDMAALDIIVTEAGGRFSALDGTDGPFGGNALATNGHLHEAALAFLGTPADDDDDPDARPSGPGSVSDLHVAPTPLGARRRAATAAARLSLASGLWRRRTQRCR